MPVHLKIEKCAECPFQIHVNRPGKLVNVPVCMKAGRDLPYIVRIDQPNRYIATIPIAESSDVIPTWCPLRTNEEEGE